MCVIVSCQCLVECLLLMLCGNIEIALFDFLFCLSFSKNQIENFDSFVSNVHRRNCSGRLQELQHAHCRVWLRQAVQRHHGPQRLWQEQHSRRHLLRARHFESRSGTQSPLDTVVRCRPLLRFFCSCSQTRLRFVPRIRCRRLPLWFARFQATRFFSRKTRKRKKEN